ncbi:MAG: class I SAM-dependent methyltransferase [Leptolyngbyaceae cyanobacterium bins.59]|nr:class I SAM-dependent methyltransferase [Leptolyngbyaceae cyanobacterium bins.59]
MATGKDTIFERYLAPVLELLVDQKAVMRAYESIDWQAATDRLRCSTLTYPEYYESQNFHGIQGGYLNREAALSYDPILQYALPPNEALVRQEVVQAVKGHPRRILDLACGTGSTTLLLKQAFPDAEVIGLDLSVPMLVIAESKAKKAGVPLTLVHGNAERTLFPDASFDLVTASLLFHETPPSITRAILTECHRLLTVGGEIVILDGNQKTLNQVGWLTEIFEEPYIKSYAAGNLDAWLGRAGFGAVTSRDLWWIHQVSYGVKPLSAQNPDAATVRNRRDARMMEDNTEGMQPAFGTITVGYGTQSRFV